MDFPQCEPQSYGAIVPSPTSDGTPFFLVTALIDNQKFLEELHHSEFQPALERALTAWVKETREGRLWYETKGYLLRLEDIEEFLKTMPSESLKPFLQEVGIHALSIRHYSTKPIGWHSGEALVLDIPRGEAWPDTT